MKRIGALLAAGTALAVFAVAYSGHEVPIYPSYYPQEIRIETLDARAAAQRLTAGKLHAYVGAAPVFASNAPAHLRRVESLGSYLVLSINRAPPRDEAAACTLAQSMLRELAQAGQGLTFHPYPVTPLHGDYLYHADQADAARSRWLARPPDGAGAPRPKVRSQGALATALARSRWPTATSSWDATLEEIDARGLVAAVAFRTNGWNGPPWLKKGWFHAERLLAHDLAPADRSLAAQIADRLRTAAYASAEEEANLERTLVRLLTRGCHRVLVGYTLTRETYNTDYTAGIENIGYDSHAGLASPIFIRTVKLKDFPWNGWLRLGVPEDTDSAWNPIAGFSTEPGRLMWLAVGDLALFPAPYGSGWEINRMAGVKASTQEKTP